MRVVLSTGLSKLVWPGARQGVRLEAFLLLFLRCACCRLVAELPVILVVIIVIPVIFFGTVTFTNSRFSIAPLLYSHRPSQILFSLSASVLFIMLSSLLPSLQGTQPPLLAKGHCRFVVRKKGLGGLVTSLLQGV